jgi:hypothetical protein
MSSEARAAFEGNREDIERLLEIHGDLTGSGPGRRRGVEVLNKSGIVLMCAVWEAYCEDLAAEAVEHLVVHAADSSALPKELRKQIAKELEDENNDLAVWQLAGDNWRTVLRTRLAVITEARNRKLNTPKSTNIEELFAHAVGLPGVTASWKWRGTTPLQAQRKLDGFVTLRGEIAHRAAAPSAIKKRIVKNFVEHAERLVDATDDCVNTQIATVCGQRLF